MNDTKHREVTWSGPGRAQASALNIAAVRPMIRRLYSHEVQQRQRPSPSRSDRTVPLDLARCFQQPCCHEFASRRSRSRGVYEPAASWFVQIVSVDNEPRSQ